MNVAVVGSGGREHAILTAFEKSKNVDKLFAIPGNAGMENIAELIPVKAMDFEGIYAAVKEKAIDLVFVAPDDPLAAGLVDFLEERGVRAFGPRKNAAIIEGSKAFSKDFMIRHGIPTAEYAAFDDYQKASAYLETASYPIVMGHRPGTESGGSALRLRLRWDSYGTALRPAEEEKTQIAYSCFKHLSSPVLW